jgi:hypothetical protein
MGIYYKKIQCTFHGPRDLILGHMEQHHRKGWEQEWKIVSTGITLSLLFIVPIHLFVYDE